MSTESITSRVASLSKINAQRALLWAGIRAVAIVGPVLLFLQLGSTRGSVQQNLLIAGVVALPLIVTSLAGDALAWRMETGDE